MSRVLRVAAGTLTEKSWRFVPPELERVFSRVEGSFPTRLSDVAEIPVGLQTSADDVYVVRELEEQDTDPGLVRLSHDGREWEIERGILRPFLHDKELAAFVTPVPNALLIFPYRVHGSGGDVQAQLILPDEMETEYPRCWEYLRHNHTRLAGRSISGGPLATRQWYQFGRGQSLTCFEEEKIIFPVLSLGPRYALCSKDILFTGGGNGPYNMIQAEGDAGVSNLYLLAVLSHPLMESLVRAGSSFFRGGYYSHGKQFLAGLPVPIPTAGQLAQVESLCAETIEAHNEWKTAGTRPERIEKERLALDLRRELRSLVDRLLELSTEELAVVDSLPQV